MSRVSLPDPAKWSDLVVYADESGDHGMENIDQDYPVFALAFVIMTREHYVTSVTPNLQRLKFKYWGHDQVVFHEREIRKKVGQFSILAKPAANEAFMADLTSLIATTDMRVCVAVIDKIKHKAKYVDPWSPYEIALCFCMERLLAYMREFGQGGRTVHVVFESRGRSEDDALELEFRRIAANKANWGRRRPDYKYATFEPVFARKDANAAGLQLADLIARPCGLRVLRPNQPNKAFDVIQTKMGQFDAGWKTFP